MPRLNRPSPQAELCPKVHTFSRPNDYSGCLDLSRAVQKGLQIWRSEDHFPQVHSSDDKNPNIIYERASFLPMFC